MNETKRKIRDWGDVPKQQSEPEPSVEEVREFTTDKKVAYVPGAMHRHVRGPGGCFNYRLSLIEMYKLQRAKNLTYRMWRSSLHWAPRR